MCEPVMPCPGAEQEELITVSFTIAEAKSIAFMDLFIILEKVDMPGNLLKDFMSVVHKVGDGLKIVERDKNESAK